jgi:hypothetical protein
MAREAKSKHVEPERNSVNPKIESMQCAKVDLSITDTIAALLANIVAQNEDVELTPRLNAAYAVFAMPWMYEWAEIGEYMNRLKEWISCGAESFVVAVCLLKRLESLNAIPPLTQRSVHRVFFTSLVLAVKIMEDETLTNSDFAKVGCVTPRQLQRMELHSLKALGFNCLVLPTEYSECCRELVRAEACMLKRNLKPFARQGPEPVLINDVSNELRPLPPAPTRKISFFGIRRKSSKPSVTATSPSVKVPPPPPSEPTTPKSTTTTTISSNPKTPTTTASKPPPGVRRTTSVSTNLAAKATRPASIFASNRRKSCSGDADANKLTARAGDTSSVAAAAAAATAAHAAAQKRAAPRLLLRQDSI